LSDPVYTIQPVVKPLSNQFDNRFDDRMYRVNGTSGIQTTFNRLTYSTRIQTTKHPRAEAFKIIHC